MSGAELATQSKEKPRGYSALLSLAGEEFLKKTFDPNYASEGFGLNLNGAFSKDEADRLISIAHPIIYSINQELLVSLQEAQPNTFELIEKHIKDFFLKNLNNSTAINQAVYECAMLIAPQTNEERSLLADQLSIVILTIKNILGDNSFLPFQLSIFDPKVISITPDSRPPLFDKEYLQNSLFNQIDRTSRQQESPTIKPAKKSLLSRVVNSLRGSTNKAEDVENSNQTQEPSLSREQVNMVLDIFIDAYLKHYLIYAYQSMLSLIFNTIRQQHYDFQEKEKQKVEAAIMELERQDYLEYLENNPTARLVTLQPIFQFPLLLKSMLFEKDKPEIAQVYRVNQRGKYFPHYSVEVAIENPPGERNWREILRVYQSDGDSQNTMTTTATVIITDESPEVVQLLESIQKQDLLVSQK